MTSDTYGRRYPGAGGARSAPPSGGAPYHPMPEGIINEVPVIEQREEVREPSLLGRLIGRKPTVITRDVVVGTRIEKRYR